MKRIEVTIYESDNVYTKYEIPQGDVTWMEHTITTCPHGEKHVAEDIEGMTITWPIDATDVEVETNDPTMSVFGGMAR